MTLLGPNGAGKTTLMRLISGYIEPTAGSVSILEHDIREERFQALTHIGYVPENSPAYGDMTVLNILISSPNSAALTILPLPKDMPTLPAGLDSLPLSTSGLKPCPKASATGRLLPPLC